MASNNNRHSSPQHTDSTAGISRISQSFPGIEALPVDHGPELSPAEKYPGLSQSPSFFNSPGKSTLAVTTTHRLRKWRLWHLYTIAIAVIIIILVIALPLTLVRHKKRSSVRSNEIATGAYNGTGMALLQLGTSYQDYAYHLYYQHATGGIRDLELRNYEWVPASYTDVPFPASARNGTPMALASYAEDAKSYPTYHLFYIDSSGILQETINSDGASIWDRGSLGNLNVIPSTSDSVGLTACSNERWNGANVPMEERTFELYYGGNDTLVHELIFNFGNRSWTSHSPFPNTQGNAGIACSASNASWSYVFLTNTENKLELWWKDSNNTAANNAARTTSHPLGIWSKVLDPAPIITHPNSPISRIRTDDTTNFLFFQDPSYAVKALQPVLNAENSTWGSLLDVGSAVAGPGSRMMSGTMFQGNFSTMPNLTAEEHRLNLAFHVFFQNDENNITEYIRNIDGGQWTSNVLIDL